MSFAHCSVRSHDSHDSKNDLHHPIMNLRLSFTPPRITVPVNISALRAFFFRPDAFPVSGFLLDPASRACSSHCSALAVQLHPAVTEGRGLPTSAAAVVARGADDGTAAVSRSAGRHSTTSTCGPSPPCLRAARAPGTVAAGRGGGGRAIGPPPSTRTGNSASRRAG